MIYHDFQGLQLSALGLGAMRLPTLADGSIDEAAARDLVAEAMAGGINYYDTAWGYHGGNSELVMGRILKDYRRDSFYLASKFPGYDLNNMDKVEEIFEKQLEKCQVDYFDFYLFHNVCEANIDAYLDPKYGIFDYLVRQKANGRIRHLGFSAHATPEIMTRFLDAYGHAMEFCQIQLNYLDWTLQDAKAKVELLRARNLPIWVMEPVRGGRLAKLPADQTAKLAALRPEESVPAWAFRFIQTLEGIGVTLSGMSNLDQLRENMKTFQEAKPLSGTEQETLLGIVKEMLGTTFVPCTACRYCTSGCPQQLDIPYLLELYNERAFTGAAEAARMPAEKQPSACVGCRSCEAVCPQQIKISEVLADFAAQLDT